MRLATNSLKIGTLPPNKTAVTVFSNFLSYMFPRASTYIREAYPDGDQLLDELTEDRIRFILTHPNGWEGSQQ